MISCLKKERLPLILLALALLTRLVFLSYPAEVVFDEVHFGKFVSAYMSGEYYFDIHPPLGKMMIAGASRLFGVDAVSDPDETFKQIGGVFDSKTLFVLRFLPALFGAFLVLVIYELVLILGCSPKAAFFGGLLALLDTALLGQSKFILIDSLMLFFGFLSLYLFFRARNYPFLEAKYFLFLALAAAFAVLAASIKWTGLSFLGMLLVLIAVEFFRSFEFKKLLMQILIFAFVPLILYYAVFALHFKLLPNSGPGNAYMSQEFQKTLRNNMTASLIKPLSGPQKFLELNKAMWNYNAGLTATHPYSSFWYGWPYGKKPIWYWSKAIEEKRANIYLVANPIVWWPASAAALIATVAALLPGIRKKIPPAAKILVFGYLLNFLPFIKVSRVAFLYHYLAALIFGIMLLAFFFDWFFGETPRAASIVYACLILAALGTFIFFAPFTYGFPSSQALTELLNRSLRIFN